VRIRYFAGNAPAFVISSIWREREPGAALSSNRGGEATALKP